MKYAIAILVSFVFCGLSFSSEVTNGNITHLKNGREPNAGAAIFPTIPIVPLMFLAVTWFGYWLIPDYATLVLWILFAIFVASWTRAYRGQRKVLADLTKKAQSEQDGVPNDR